MRFYVKMVAFCVVVSLAGCTLSPKGPSVVIYDCSFDIESHYTEQPQLIGLSKSELFLWIKRRMPGDLMADWSYELTREINRTLRRLPESDKKGIRRKAIWQVPAERTYALNPMNVIIELDKDVFRITRIREVDRFKFRISSRYWLAFSGYCAY